MSRDIVFLNASPSVASRSSFVAKTIAEQTERAGYRSVFWGLGDFDPTDVLFGRTSGDSVVRFITAVKTSAAVVLASPVYKASYSGGLKAIVDLIPPDALERRPILGIATVRLAAHAAEVDRSFQALLDFFQARRLETLVIVDDELRVTSNAGVFSDAARERVHKAGFALVASIAEEGSAQLLSKQSTV
ncbi:MAG: NAD(P)H-dependent oxidoreductase [Polyangiaceae bacterium]|jgi:FMN reductase